ncbi:hypothetical protein NDU88_001231 [Pleurodeles waltl]|uniref:Lamina-associated polypeptide 2 alpha C-terminal domain-containing protein n=1 Tax=Pleurodeles waltl TaxID=8319 RepID=A0AAV7KSC4_PLEWA|nr:hypothetical protein NDU88_001231 [Pleurodeles waltl]
MGSGFPWRGHGGSCLFPRVIRNAADFLDLPLPTAEVKRNLLTEVLHPASASAEPLLPFNEALLDPIKDIWLKPVSTTPVNRAVARRYRTAPGDPVFLSRQPSPESLVVQASCSSRSSPGSFPGTPADRESKKMDHTAKKTFSSCSMALKSSNATCILGRYIHALMEEAKGHPNLSQEMLQLLADAQAAATQVIQSGLDTSDSVARAMGTTIVSRRQSWLRSSGFSSDVQATLLDLPFDGEKLFGTKADSALERFKESRATARSLGLQSSASSSFRGFRRFKGFGARCSKSAICDLQIASPCDSQFASRKLLCSTVSQTPTATRNGVAMTHLINIHEVGRKLRPHCEYRHSLTWRPAVVSRPPCSRPAFQ